MIDGALVDLNDIQRIVVTANGCLQQIYSSIFNEKVGITVIYNEFDDKKNILNRQILLRTLTTNTLLYTAMSSVEIFNEQILEEIKTGKVGLGQIFEKYEIVTQFELHEFSGNNNSGPDSAFKMKYPMNFAHISPNSTFYRSYSLVNADITSHISEIHFTSILSFEDPTYLLRKEKEEKPRSPFMYLSKDTFYVEYRKVCTTKTLETTNSLTPGLQLSVATEDERDKKVWVNVLNSLKYKRHLVEAITSLTQQLPRLEEATSTQIFESTIKDIPLIKIAEEQEVLEGSTKSNSGYFILISL